MKRPRDKFLVLRMDAGVGEGTRAWGKGTTVSSSMVGRGLVTLDDWDLRATFPFTLQMDESEWE